MTLDLVIEIYLWILIIISLVLGGLITGLLIHERRAPENAEATEKWINEIQKFFWIFVIVMGIAGLALFLTATHMWFPKVD